MSPKQDSRKRDSEKRDTGTPENGTGKNGTAEIGTTLAGSDTRTEAGVWCRHCGEITSWTIQSSHAAEGIVRLRRCRSCWTVYRTIEIYFSAKAGDVCSDYPSIKAGAEAKRQHRREKERLKQHNAWIRRKSARSQKADAGQSNTGHR